MKKLVLAFALALGMAAGADNVAELLQKGIYTQETLGDLEGAIKIYRQIVAQSKESRAHAAQAQLRLAQCLLRKGQADEARQLFEKLIEEYPEQKEIVAKARELAPGGLKLLPEPWSDGELMVLDIKLPGGMTIGQNIYLTESISVGGKAGWRFGWRQYIPGSDGLMSAEVERDSFKPVRGAMKHSLMGKTEIEFETNGARVLKPGKAEWERVSFSGIYYDNTQVHHLVRRLPLATGYKVKLPLLTAFAPPLELTIEVTARETVSVPMGKIDAFKIEFPMLKQSFWVGADANRYIVKFDVNGAVGELVSVRKLDKMAPVELRHPSGLAFAAPQGWYHWVQEPKPDRTLAHLLDPAATAVTTIGLHQIDAAKHTNDTVAADLRERSVEKAKELAGYAVRPDSWKSQNVSGRTVVSYVADFKERDKPMSELVIWSQSAGKRTILQSKAEPADGAKLQAQLEAIYASSLK